MTDATTRPTLVIRPSGGLLRLNPGDVWAYRELLFFLVWRDIKVRYKQTALGAAWAVIQPVAAMVVFSIFFGRLGRIPSDGIPYPLFAFAGLLPWQLFAFALTESSNSLVGSQNLITKVYFPRIIIPLASVLAGLVDFFIGLAILLGLMAWYGIAPSGAIIWLPLLVLFAVLAALSVGLWLSALNVKYRDVRYVIPFLTQLWMFASPIAYPSSLVPEKWRVWYGLNPMAGVVDGFRWALLGKTAPPGMLLLVSAMAVLTLFWFGAVYFRRAESTFADVV